jgi:hypothetical protein
VPAAEERFGERAAEEAGAAGDHDVHALFNPEPVWNIPPVVIRRSNRRRRP